LFAQLGGLGEAALPKLPTTNNQKFSIKNQKFTRKRAWARPGNAGPIGRCTPGRADHPWSADWITQPPHPRARPRPATAGRVPRTRDQSLYRPIGPTSFRKLVILRRPRDHRPYHKPQHR